MLLYLDKGANSKSEIPCQVSSDHQLHLDFINKDACTAIMQVSPLAIGELRLRTSDRRRQRQKGILNKSTYSNYYVAYLDKAGD